MSILIDGYNLLNATGVEGTGEGTALRRARRGLLEFLAEVLTEEERARTTIVFDAAHAPPGLPRAEQFGGITVCYAKGYAEADDLIEELIGADHAPRQLLVVSSDRRLQRAAHRRRATAIDSRRWIAQLQRRTLKPPAASPHKPAPTEETDHWLREFADVDIHQIESEIDENAGRKPADEIFPPGYGEDALDEQP